MTDTIEITHKFVRFCKRCEGSGRLWVVEAKEWAYGDSEPMSHPTPVRCSSCEGTGAAYTRR